MPGAKVIKPKTKNKEKKKGFFTKIKDALDGDKTKPGFQIINRTGRAKPRPQQKQVPKNKLKTVIKKDIKNITKSIKSALTGGGSKAKASTIKRKDKPKKETSREANARAAGVTGKMPKAKDSQVMKAEAARRKRSKDKAAKKTARTKAADNRDAKRGGFISANAMKSSAKNANAKMAANKKRKSDELVSRGRK